MNGVPHDAIARLNPDGTLDPNFTANGSGFISTVALQKDGKILVGGMFSEINGTLRSNIARLNPNGTLGTVFDPGADNTVFQLIVLPNDKILVGGAFSELDGQTHSLIARLNADGTPDPEFNASTDNVVDVMTVQPDGKLLIGGFFGEVNGDTTRSRLARLNGSKQPIFFNDAIPLGNGVYYRSFPNYPEAQPFGYYSFLPDSHYIYHFDLGYEYVMGAADSEAGVYLYDFKSSTFFYTSPSFPFPYLYDFSLNSVVYYFPDPAHPGHYNIDGVRYFYDFATGQVITK